MANESALNEAIPRKVMTLFLLVDCSGSMSINGNIGKVNGAIEEMGPLLKEVSDENADAEIRIAVLSFSTGCRWVTNGSESLDLFTWNDLEAGGLTEMGAAFVELESKLSRSEFLGSATGAYAPVIILLTDGQPNDNWEQGLEKLKHNNWYKNATKIAIGVDEGANDTALSVLSAFTGSPETVLKVNGERDTLKNLLKRLAVISSTMQSRSTTATMETDEEQAKKIAKDAVDSTLENGQYGNDVTPAEPPKPSTQNPWDAAGKW